MLRILGPMLIMIMMIPAGGDAQQARASHSVFLDGHTHTTPFSLDYNRVSLNYDHFFRPGIGLEIGVSVYQWRHVCPVPMDPDDCTSNVVRVPLQILWLSGPDGDHHLEVGGGAMLGYSSGRFGRLGADGGMIWGVPVRVGYRYQKPGGGLSFRAAYTPPLAGSPAPNWVSFAIGAGYTF